MLSYFSQQEQELKPSCIVKPNSAQDVATAVKLLTALGQFECPFAVRGGGHTAWAGSANINNGITIDLSAMNQVDLNIPALQTRVGPGATWGDIYSKLDPLNLTVIGGRASQVGIAGLTLGGKSMPSSIYPMTLPERCIQEVSHTYHPATASSATTSKTSKLSSPQAKSSTPERKRTQTSTKL